MSNHIKLILGEHEHFSKDGRSKDNQKKNINKLACFRKYIKPSWNKYDEKGDKSKIHHIEVDGWLSTKNIYTYQHVIGKIKYVDIKFHHENREDSVVIKYLPYFTKLVLLSRLNYSQINELKLNFFSRGIIWLLRHLEHAFNPNLYS